tara:strand:+ start:12359 stop:12544 length:186 start_codon:yes stop_codon:yes gene_type:complete
MGRVDKVVREANGKYPYYVEMRNKDNTWRSEVRYYDLKQDVKDYPDNKSRRNFKYLGKDED